MVRAVWRCLQFRDRSPDPHPDKLPVAVAAVEHEIGPSGGQELGIGAMPADQQVRGAPDVEIGDSGCL